MSSLEPHRLQVLLSKHRTNSILVISFALLIISKLLDAADFGLLFSYWVHCLTTVRQRSPESLPFDRGFQLRLLADRSVEISNSLHEQHVEIPLAAFSLCLETEVETFKSLAPPARTARINQFRHSERLLNGSFATEFLQIVLRIFVALE